MFVPAPIQEDFAPHTKRPVLRRNAALFVDATGGGGGSRSRVLPQAMLPCGPGNCAGKPDGTPCCFPGMSCQDGVCV